MRGTRHTPGSAQLSEGSSSPSPEPKLLPGFAVFSPLPEDLHLVAPGVKPSFQPEGIKGNFWLESVAAGGTGCT